MKRNIKHETIWKFKGENKINTKDMCLLLEAFRRKHLLNPDPNKTWLGLGTINEYKSKYFRTHDGSNAPWINHWFVLTESGKEMMRKMESAFIVPSKPKAIISLNEFLFSY